MQGQSPAIFLPLLVQVLLTVVLYIALGQAKKRSAKAGTVDLGRRALHADAWPESIQQINNCIGNQFQVPVLFYVVVMVLYQLGAGGIWAQALAWVFVASRVVHAYVHTGSNEVPVRRAVFTFGVLVLIVLLAMAGWAAVSA